jgi:hypothetical protein
VNGAARDDLIAATLETLTRALVELERVVRERAAGSDGRQWGYAGDYLTIARVSLTTAQQAVAQARQP